MATELKLPQLNYLLEEFPQQHDFISRLDTLIAGRNASLKLSMEETIDILQPTDIRTFVLMLKSVEQTGLVKYSVEVNGSDGEKIQEFSTLLDIPLLMFDPVTQKDFTVLLTDVCAKYTFNSPYTQTNKLKIK